MRVAILTNGSRGDVQPYVALGSKLAELGDEVTVSAPEPFRDLVRSRGLSFAGLRFDNRDVTQRLLKDGPGLLGFARGAREVFATPVLVDMLHTYQGACEGADAIIYTPLGFFGHHLAQASGKPSVGAAVQPLFQPTRYIQSPFAPVPPSILTRENSPGRALLGPYSYATHVLTEQMLWQAVRRQANEAFREVLGVSPYSFFSPLGRLRAAEEPGVLGWSERVVPKPPDWSTGAEVTGYWYLPYEPGYVPPSGLKEFIDAGPKPVSVGFGSMNDARGMTPGRFTKIVLEALDLAGARAVLLTGWGALSDKALPESVFAAEEVPHDWLFSRMAAAVHHCGAGTTAASLAAGVPTVGVPLFADQPFWAARVHRLGVGPRPIGGRRLSPASLAVAIRQALTDAAMRERAASLGVTIRAEDGVGAAARASHRAVQCRNCTAA